MFFDIILQQETLQLETKTLASLFCQAGSIASIVFCSKLFSNALSHFPFTAIISGNIIKIAVIPISLHETSCNHITAQRN